VFLVGFVSLLPTKIERTVPLIISLTSTKHRIGYELPLTLASLIRQETVPDAIHLYLALEDEAEMRPWMRDRVMPQLAGDKRAALIQVESSLLVCLIMF
jgi:hypothetical protein